MKKQLLLLILILLPLTAGAQTRTGGQRGRTPKKPEEITITKFVVSASGQELQMRQRPNINAPKLVFLRDDHFHPYEPGKLKWDNKNLKRSLVTPVKSKIFAVVGEEGDWYKVFDHYSNMSGIYSQVGYLQKKDCVDAELQPITKYAFADIYDLALSQVIIQNISQDNTCIITSGCPPYGPCVGYVFCIGRVKDNIAFMCFSDEYGFYVDDQTNEITIGNSSFDNSCLIRFNGDYKEVNFANLTTNDIQKLQRDNDKGKYNYIYINAKGYGLHLFPIDDVDDREVTIGTQLLPDGQIYSSGEEPVDVGMDDFDEEFDGVYEEGLMGSIPEGTTVYEGDMGGFPIVFTIIRNDSEGVLKAIYKNVKSGKTIQMFGESLPAMGGNITFFGTDNGKDWNFDLTGDGQTITGSAYGNGKDFNVKLHRK